MNSISTLITVMFIVLLGIAGIKQNKHERSEENDRGEVPIAMPDSLVIIMNDSDSIVNIVSRLSDYSFRSNVRVSKYI